MPLPILQTDRLILRPFRAEDVDEVHAYASDPEVVRYMVWGPNTREDTTFFLHQLLEHQQNEDRADYHYAITLAGNGRLIGGCSLVMEHPELGEASFGYVLNRAFWGRGYATEAAAELLRFGFQDLRLHRIYATCRPQNTASRNVLEKLAMRQEAHFRKHIRIRGEWADSLLFAVLAEEWQEPPHAAVLFDMDGVLVNTEPIYFRSNQKIFNKLGFSQTPEEYARFVGLSAEKMWETLKSEYGLSQAVPELVRMEKEGMLRGLQQADLEPMPGLLDLLARLEAKHIPLGLASSSAHPVIRTILSKLSLEDRFQVLTSGEDVENGKPAPDIFLLAAKTLGVSPARCVVIEDSASGVRAAKAAGMVCIGFRNLHSGNQDLSTADVVVDGFDPGVVDRIVEITFRQRDR